MPHAPIEKRIGRYNDKSGARAGEIRSAARQRRPVATPFCTRDQISRGPRTTNQHTDSRAAAALQGKSSLRTGIYYTRMHPRAM